MNAAAEALEARIDAMFDDVMAVALRIQAQMRADGLIREPEVRTRCDDVAVAL